MFQKTIQAIKTFLSKYGKYWVIIPIILAFFFMYRAEQNRTLADNWQAKYQYEHQTIDSIKNSLGQKVVQQDIVITSDKKFIKQQSDSIFKLTKSEEKKIKEVDALITENQQLKITNKFIPFDSTQEDTTEYIAGSNNKIIIDKDSIIIPPKIFYYSDSDYSIAGKVELHGVQLDSIKANDTVSVRIVKYKPGLFKKEKIEVQIIHSNKDFDTKSAKSIMLNPQDSKWNRIYKPILFGIVGFAAKALL